ncbi:MAG TPA: GDSL-type esterase/lipase family protein [Ktedonobacterales bacterium]|nr:GDSL-type esterase/lipase family protein [Ktedonobacterales bacterium]
MPHQPNQQQRYTRQRPYPNQAAILLVLATITVFVVACGTTQQRQSLNDGTPTAQRHTVTYVAIGASDSFGVGTENPGRDSWPSVLADSLETEGTDIHLINLGIPGETTAEARKTELPIALDAQPALVTVWLGVNDILQAVSVDEYEKQLEGLLRSLHDHTHALVFVGNIPNLSLLPYFAGFDQTELQTTIAHWNAAIAHAVAITGSRLVDLHTTWAELATHPEYIASDGLHPSTIGAMRLAEVFQSWIALSFGTIRATADVP